jgi:LPXTG-motif cell wall-anchored protein
VFIVGLVAIGVTFGGSTDLPQTGAIALVALLAGFVLLMAGVGTYLMRAGDES